MERPKTERPKTVRTNMERPKNGAAKIGGAKPRRQPQTERSKRPARTSVRSAEGWTPGGGAWGGNRIHFLRPETTAFHALVLSGDASHGDGKRHIRVST